MTGLDVLTTIDAERREKVAADLAMLRLLGCPNCGADLLAVGWIRYRSYRHELPYFVHDGTVYQDWDHEESGEVLAGNEDVWTCGGCNEALIDEVRAILDRLDYYAEMN